MDDWTPPEEHHAISIDAMNRWQTNKTLSKADLSAIETNFRALHDGSFDVLRDAAASLITTMCLIAKEGDKESAIALHNVVLTAKPRFNRWRAANARSKEPSEEARYRMNEVIGSAF